MYNQSISITHEIYQSFEDGLEVRGVFLDLSKAFDMFWHEGIIYKLKQNRKQRVVLNGQHSKWANIEAGVPQGSILGPLLMKI